MIQISNRLLSLSVIFFILVSICVIFPPSTAYSAWSGTAFFINNQGDIVTAAHVVLGPRQKNNNIFYIEYKGQFVKATVVGINSDADVAILHTNVHPTDWIPLEIQAPNYDNIGVFGYPRPDQKGDNLKMTLGTSHKGYLFSDGLYTSAIICPGNSGGPIVNLRGNAVGILTENVNTYNTDKLGCGPDGWGPSISYVITLANKYNVSYSAANLKYKSFDTLFTQYQHNNTVVLIYGWNSTK